MKTNSIIRFLFLAGCLHVALNGCKLEQEDVFPDSSAKRTEAALADYKNILCASANGWVMEYFPTADAEGYTFLMKFDASGKTFMAAKNRWTKNEYVADTSHFEFVGDDGPVLTFNTAGSYVVNDEHIGIFHLFSNPLDPAGTSNLDGVGLGGDYEFNVLSASADSLMLKGKKRGTNIRLRKLGVGKSWESYFADIDAMKLKIVNPNLEDLQLVFDGGNSYVLKTNVNYQGALGSIFKIYPFGGDAISDAKDYSYIVTPSGLRLYAPYAAQDRIVQTFAMDGGEQRLVCTDKGAKAYIAAMPSTQVLGYLLNARRYMVFSTAEGKMSASVNTSFAAITTALSTSGRKLDYLGFVNNKTYGISLAVSSTKGSTKVEGFLGFSITSSSANEVTLKFNGFTGSYDKNGQTYYNSFALSGFVFLLEDTYTVEVQGPALASTTFKLTGKSDSSKWFVLALR